VQWEEAPQFTVEVNGKLDINVRTFQPMVSKPFLMLAFEGKKPHLMIDLSAKKVVEIARSGVKFSDEYTITTAGIPSGKTVSAYAVKAGASIFSIGGKQYSVRLRETPVGEVSLNILLAQHPEYAIMRDRYKPKKQAMQFLRGVKTPTEIVVMFATWCATCKQVLPDFIKVMQSAKNPAFKVRFIGIAMGGNEPRTELEKYGHDYPAIIVFQHGAEKGRIIGVPVAKVEDKLVSFIKKR